jgi:hypothetical protein
MKFGAWDLGLFEDSACGGSKLSPLRSTTLAALARRPIEKVRRSKNIQCKQDLADLAPKRYFISAEAVEGALGRLAGSRYFGPKLGTLTLLEATRKHCPEAPFIFCSTNRSMAIHQTRLPLVEQESREVAPEHHSRVMPSMEQRASMPRHIVPLMSPRRRRT